MISTPERHQVPCRLDELPPDRLLAAESGITFPARRHRGRTGAPPARSLAPGSTPIPASPPGGGRTMLQRYPRHDPCGHHRQSNRGRGGSRLPARPRRPRPPGGLRSRFGGRGRRTQEVCGSDSDRDPAHGRRLRMCPPSRSSAWSASRVPPSRRGAHCPCITGSGTCLDVTDGAPRPRRKDELGHRSARLAGTEPVFARPRQQGQTDHPRRPSRCALRDVSRHGALEPSMERIGAEGRRDSSTLPLTAPCGRRMAQLLRLRFLEHAVRRRTRQAFAFLLDLRHVAGILPADVETDFSIDESGAGQPAVRARVRAAPSDPFGGGRPPGLIGTTEQALRTMPSSAHARPALFIDHTTHDASTSPCAFFPALPTLAPRPAPRQGRRSSPPDCLAFPGCGGDDMCRFFDLRLGGLAMGESPAGAASHTAAQQRQFRRGIGP